MQQCCHSFAQPHRRRIVIGAAVPECVQFHGGCFKGQRLARQLPVARQRAGNGCQQVRVGQQPGQRGVVLQAQRNRPDASLVEYRSAGLVPSRSRHSARRYPMTRFPWARTEEALREIAKYGADGLAEVDYINPETGQDVLPTMGFTAMMLAKGQADHPPQRSCSSAFHVVKGSGTTVIDGKEIAWGPKDTFTAAPFAVIDHKADEESFLIRVHDRPLQDKLGYYEERAR